MRRKKLSIRDALKKYGELYKRLYIYRNALSVQISKINNRLKNIEEKIRWYKEKKDLETAVLYAREYKNLHIVREVLWHIKLNVEGVLGRIDTIKTVAAAFEDFDITIKTLTQILKDSKAVFSAFSEVSSELLSSYIDIKDTLVPPEPDFSYIITPTEDALDILKNIERKVGEELSRKFPNVPTNLDKLIEGNIENGIARLYNVLATDGGVNIPIRNSYPIYRDDIGDISIKINLSRIKSFRFRDLTKLERLMLNYLIRTGRKGYSKINIYSMARLFRTTPLQILDSLYSLSEVDLVRFS